MSFIIKKATRKAKKLRLGLSASSGFGKTKSALLLAYGLVGDWSKICVIDSERESSSLYSDMGNYSIIDLQKPYTPERYIEAIEMVEKSGFEVCIVDSITHEWAGEGGCLDIHANLGGDFKTWGKVTPRHNAFVNKILTSKCHVITTVRRKQEYDMIKEGGRTSIQKLGTGEITRDGFEYELDINFEIVNEKHMTRASKDRSQLFSGKPEFIITEDTGRLIKDWCNEGISNLDEAMEKVRSCEDLKELTNLWTSYNKELGLNEDFKIAVKKKQEDLTIK